jgi:uncharacterized membrane protein
VSIKSDQFKCQTKNYFGFVMQVFLYHVMFNMEGGGGVGGGDRSIFFSVKNASQL